MSTQTTEQKMVPLDDLKDALERAYAAERRAEAAEQRLADAERKTQAFEQAESGRQLDRAIEREASDLGAEFPADFPSLIDRSVIAEEDGQFINVRRTVEKFLQSRPNMYRPDRRPQESKTAPARRPLGPPQAQGKTPAEVLDNSIRRVVNTSRL